MEGNSIYEAIYQMSHFAPLVIIVASILDIFLVTGFILYGAAMITTVAAMHMSGMITTEALIMSASIGTVTGNILNYWLGRLFGETEYVKKKLEHPKMIKAKVFLKSRGLLLYMTASRFIAVIRPMYAVLLGSMNISFRRFIAYEIPLAVFWVIFWLVIIVEGEQLYSRLMS